MDQPPAQEETTLDDSPFALTRYSEYLPHVCAMAAGCGRQLNIFTQEFDPAILDHEAVTDAIRSFVIDNGRAAQVKILVQRPETAIRQGHRLVELARKLSSFVKIHCPASQHRAITEAYLTFDNTAYLYRDIGDQPEGRGCYKDSLRTLELNWKFEEIWAMSEPEAEFRRLGL